jgi:hypothetical protein
MFANNIGIDKACPGMKVVWSYPEYIVEPLQWNTQYTLAAIDMLANRIYIETRPGTYVHFNPKCFNLLPMYGHWKKTYKRNLPEWF